MIMTTDMPPRIEMTAPYPHDKSAIETATGLPIMSWIVRKGGTPVFRLLGNHLRVVGALWPNGAPAGWRYDELHQHYIPDYTSEGMKVRELLKVNLDGLL